MAVFIALSIQAGWPQWFPAPQRVRRPSGKPRKVEWLRLTPARTLLEQKLEPEPK
jgi:hypothetical protein